MSSFRTLLRKKGHNHPWLVSRRRRRLESRLILVVQHRVSGVLIRPADPSYFSQELELFNAEKHVFQCSSAVGADLRRAAKEGVPETRSSSRRARGRVLCRMNSTEAS